MYGEQLWSLFNLSYLWSPCGGKIAIFYPLHAFQYNDAISFATNSSGESKLDTSIFKRLTTEVGV